MSFKPDLNSLHECINFSSTVRDTSSSFPFSPRSTYTDSFRGHSSKARNSHDESYLRNLIKPSTAKGGSRTPMKLRETPREGQRLRKRVDFSVLDEGLSFRTTNNHCNSQRSDMTEPAENQAEEMSPNSKITANVVHRVNGRGEITRMSVPHPKSRIRTGSTQPKPSSMSQRDQEKPVVVQDPLIEKFQSNYQRLRKNIVKLTAKQSAVDDDSNNEITTGFITKLTPSSPVKYEGARHSLIIKSEDPKISDTEKTLPTDASSSPRKRFNYRKPSITTRPEVETIPTLTSPKMLNLQGGGVKPMKVYVLSEDMTLNAKTPNRPQSVQRTVKKMTPYDSPDRNDTNGDEIPLTSSRGFEEPRRLAAMFPKDTEYCRMRSIRNYIIQKKNLHFYSFTPKEYLNYKAIASMISQGTANITVIPQEQFASSFYGGTPKTDTSTKWFNKELESDLLTRSLVLGPPEKKKPVLITTRPGTTQDRLKKMRNEQKPQAQSSSPIKERNRYASTGRAREKAHNYKKGFLLPREIDNFELEGWDQKTEESQ